MIKTYLTGLTWDGVPRVETLLIDHVGAPDDAYTRSATVDFLRMAVNRAVHPGCPVDRALVLVGPQDAGKSSLPRDLGGAWHAEVYGDITNRDVAARLADNWIVELTDLRTGRAADEALKAFIHAQSDTYRAPYSRRVETRPRSCVFVVTANAPTPVMSTSPRMFRVVDCAGPYVPLTPSDRDQVWAESYQLWLANPVVKF